MVGAGEFYKWLRIFKVPNGSATGGITLTGGTGILAPGFIPLGGSGEISLDSAGSGFIEVTGTTQAMVVNKSYSSNNASLVTLTLPATADLGDQITIYGKGLGGWKIAQNSGQSIILGELQTTTTSGSLQSTYKLDIVKLTCITANTLWSALAQSGNITVA